mmetsp:Transcript_1122/g.3458  ORF Transcript_1122/g.3458 Transcript_1122/m.3458 type:complete len:202 (-) Transcript_1122:3044-3649(-)
MRGDLLRWLVSTLVSISSTSLIHAPRCSRTEYPPKMTMVRSSQGLKQAPCAVRRVSLPPWSPSTAIRSQDDSRTSYAHTVSPATISSSVFPPTSHTTPSMYVAVKYERFVNAAGAVPTYEQSCVSGSNIHTSENSCSDGFLPLSPPNRSSTSSLGSPTSVACPARLDVLRFGSTSARGTTHDAQPCRTAGEAFPLHSVIDS